MHESLGIIFSNNKCELFSKVLKVHKENPTRDKLYSYLFFVENLPVFNAYVHEKQSTLGYCHHHLSQMG